GGVVLALGGALVLTVLNINFLVRRNKDYLIGQAEQTLGRKITVDEIGVTLWSVGARLVNFALADDPAFSADAFLRAKDLRLDLRILPLLVGRFRLKSMVIESPLITIVRDARGRYNFASQADNEKNDWASADRGKEASSEKQDGTLFLVASLNVSDGTLRYRDLKNGGELTATQINLKVNDFEWDEPFDIQLEAAVMAADHNLKFKSRVGPIAGNRDYRDVPLDGDIRADALDLGKVNAALPQFRKALPEALRFDGVYTIKDLKFKGTLNNLSLKGAVSGTDASFRFE
ncbi:MAG TPA: AsmA family protein, partial [Candidatus Binatia bacterium]